MNRLLLLGVAALAWGMSLNGQPIDTPPQASPHDWPQFGGTVCRNMISTETGLPDSFAIGDRETPAQNIKWVVKFVNNYVGANTATVANGKVFIALKLAKGISDQDKAKNYMPFSCLDEKTGALLWQLNSQSGTHTTKTHSATGNLSVPTVDGNRVYLYRRNLVVCLTTDGFTGKNQGPFTDEYKEYGLESENQLTNKDADIVWMYNLYDELGVKMDHDVVYAPLVFGKYVYVSTGNCMSGPSNDDGRNKLNTENVPCFVALDKETGKLVAAEDEGIARRTIRGQWGTPCVGMVNGKAQILFGGGDGVIYAFEPVGDSPPADGKLKKIWSFDMNRAWTNWNTNYRPGGDPFDPTKYAHTGHIYYNRRKLVRPGAQLFPLGAPVCVDNRVYCALGGDWGSGTESWVYWPGGRLVCVDATKTGDITDNGLVWENTQVGMSDSTVSIAAGLLYLPDMYGKLFCIDQNTGRTCWLFDLRKPFYSCTMVADGRVYVGNNKGGFLILEASRDFNLLYETDMKGWMSGAMTVANKTLFIVAGDSLYAIAK